MRLEAMLVLLVLSGCASGGGRAVGNSPGQMSSAGRMNLALAEEYLAQNQLEKASASAAVALAADPGAAYPHAMMAMIHARNGDAAKSKREFDRALHIAPGDGSVLNAYGSTLCEQGKTGEADAQFKLALKDPNYAQPAQALVNAGRCAHGAAHWAAAEGYLRSAVAIAPEDPQVLYLLADTEFHQGNLMQARAFVERRDALGKDSATLELAARIEEAAGNSASAARYRQRINEVDVVPTDADGTPGQ